MSVATLSRRKVLAALSLPVLAGPLAACTSEKPQKKGTTHVTFATSFGAFGRDSYAWVAQKKGYFKNAGLDVTIQKGKPAQNPGSVAAGKLDFASMDYASALVKMSKDKDLAAGMRIVAGITQRSLIAMMSLQDGPVSAVTDMAGKRVVVAPGSVQDVLWSTYAKLAKIDPPGTPAHAAPPTLITMLRGGKADVIGQFVIGQPTVEKAVGKPVRVFPWSDYLTDLYGYALTANNDLVTSKPDVVRSFAGALLQGLSYAIAHPDEAGQILNDAVPTSDPKAAAAELKIMQGYVGSPVGALDKERVARSMALLEGAGAAKNFLTPDDLVAFDVVPQQGGGSQ